MEWFDKISEFMEGLPEWLQAHPRYGYLIVAGILLLWLVGIVCGWRWTYSRPGSWEGNFWLGTLGERSYRFWLGLIVAAATGCALLLFFVTGEASGKLYYRPAKLKAMQAKYETMGEYRKLLGQCLFWLYVIGSFASFFIIAEQKNHSKEQPLIERLQEIRDGKYPVEKTHSPTGE